MTCASGKVNDGEGYGRTCSGKAFTFVGRLYTVGTWSVKKWSSILNRLNEVWIWNPWPGVLASPGKKTGAAGYMPSDPCGKDG